MKSDSSGKPCSILDGVPVVNQALKSFPDYVGEYTPATIQPGYRVISACVKCGNPIYGPATVQETTEIGMNSLKRVPPSPEVIRTCGCVYMPKFTDKMQTK